MSPWPVRQTLPQKAAHEKARKILRENEAQLHKLAAHLLEKETITGEEFMALLNE